MTNYYKDRGYTYHRPLKPWPNEWRPPHDHPIGRGDPLPLTMMESLDVVCPECQDEYEKWVEKNQ